MIHVKNLKKKFVRSSSKVRHLLKKEIPSDAREILKHLNLHINPGECVGILGRNGSGKSTFLRCVGGVYPYQKGSVVLGGNFSSIYELGVAGQELLKGRDFAKKYLRIFAPECDEAQCLDFILSFSELQDFFDNPIYTYSSGMKARLFFSVAMAKKSDIYLIDEALAVGDINFQKKCWKLLKDRLKVGASGLFVTHDWSIVAKLCQRSFILEDGKIVCEGKSFDVIASYLDLSQDEPTDKIDIVIPHSIAWKAYDPINQDISIFFKEDIEKFSASFSLEKLDEKDGWNHIYHVDKKMFSNVKKGSHTLRIHTPHFFLSPGDYYLNLFFQINNTHDYAYSWTYGNGIPVRINSSTKMGLGLLTMET